MKKNSHLPEPVIKPLGPQEFMNEYEKLCKRMRYQIVAYPSFKQRDDGTFSVVINYKVVAYNPQVQP